MSDVPAAAPAVTTNNLISSKAVSLPRGHAVILSVCAVGIFLLAVSLRLMFARAVIAQNNTQELRTLHADSRGYLNKSQRIENGQSYADPSVARSREEGLVRPPLYPLFLALIQRIIGSIPAVFFVQSIFGAFVPLLVIVAGRWVWGSQRWATVLALLAGLASALSGTGIAISSIVLTDLLFSVLLLAGLLVMIRAAGDPRWIIAALAGALLAAASLTKPSTVYWPVVSIPLWIILARGANQPVRARNLIVFIGMQAALMSAWSFRNYRAEGLFTFSGIADRNLRFELAPIVEEWSGRDYFPTPGQIRGSYRRAELQGEEVLSHNNLSEYVRWEHDSAMQILRAHPALTAGAILANIYNQSTVGWHSFERQLPRRGPILRRTMLLDNVWYHPVLTPLWTILALAAVLIPNKLPTDPAETTDPLHRWHSAIVLTLWVTLIYFLLLSGTTRDQGSRILYPVEFAKIILVIEAIRRLYFFSRRIIAAEARSQEPFELPSEADRP